MAPSALNDGARGVMAAAAKYRDDIAGILVTGGTATSYTVFSNQGFDTFAHMHGAKICFVPHVTNGANGTGLNVDALGIKPLLTAPGVGLQGGVLILGTPYTATYNHTDGAFYVHGYFGNPYNVPLLGGMDHWDTVTPNSSFIFPLGQAISRTTYAYAFSRWGVTHGAGDGSTTFNVPNKAGRVSAMVDATGARLTGTFFPNAGTIGAVAGADGHILTTPQIPSHTHNNTLTQTPHSHGVSRWDAGAGNAGGSPGGFENAGQQTGTANANISIANAAAGGDGAHNNVQPTITCNYIIRII
jgi:microcystin-dependent protein